MVVPGRTGFAWRTVGHALGAVALVAAGLAFLAQPAYADVGTAPYLIGASGASAESIVAFPTTVLEGTYTAFSVKFTVTALVSAPGTAVKVSSSVPLGSAPDRVSIVDESTQTCDQAGTGGGESTTGAFTLYLESTCQLAQGDEVELTFEALAPERTGSFDFQVATPLDSAPASSSPVSVSSVPPVVSTSGSGLGANATYALSGASWSDEQLTGDFGVIVLTARALTGPTLVWYDAAGGYSVTVTPAGGSPVADVVESVYAEAAGSDGASVALELASPVAAGASLAVVGEGINPPSPSSVSFSIEPATGPVVDAISAGPAETSSNDLVFGTSLSSLSVAVSPPLQGAEATYVLSFQATTPMSGGQGSAICVSEPDGPTRFSTLVDVLVTDTTAGWRYLASGTSFASGSPPANAGCGTSDQGAVVPVPDGYDMRSGDSMTLDMAGVTNPQSGTVSDLTVSTSSDTVPAPAPPYVIGPAQQGVVVTVDPPTTGALATYTFTGLIADASMVAGSGTITLEGPPGTVFPDSAASYTILDPTTSSGSGTVAAPVAGGGTDEVTIVVPHTVNAFDHLALVVGDVVNPAGGSPSYTATLVGSVTGLSEPPPFPHANASYPNGAIIDFSGAYYVFAGGHAFGIASAGTLLALQRVDHASVQEALAGATPPSGPPRPGTLVFTRPVTGSPTVYVAGADGRLHGFATPEQLVEDGYDPAMVVTVARLAPVPIGRTAGSLGPLASALETGPDGAVLSSPAGWYVLGGGHAFVLPSAAALAALRPGDRAVPVPGAPTARQETSAVVGGTLLAADGVVYVAYDGSLWPFKSQGQLAADGYGGTAAVAVPALGGLSLQASYSGS